MTDGAIILVALASGVVRWRIARPQDWKKQVTQTQQQEDVWNTKQ